MHFDCSAPHSPSDRAVLRRVAWVTPDYPPDRGGVSDHSSAMVSVLRAAGHDVLVCSRPHEPGFARLDSELTAYGPDLVIVAYTPLGIAIGETLERYGAEGTGSSVYFNDPEGNQIELKGPSKMPASP